MASTRKMYDDCSVDLFYRQSTQPLNYRLLPEFANNCQKCYTDYGPRGTDMNVSVITNQNLIDVDSLLTNRSKVASDCGTGLVSEVNFAQQQKYDFDRQRKMQFP